MKTPTYIRKANQNMGILLQTDFLLKHGIAQKYLAHKLGVSANRINEIVQGKRAVTVDTDLRLCKFFELENGFFMHKLIDWQIQYAQTELQAKIKNISKRK